MDLDIRGSNSVPKLMLDFSISCAVGRHLQVGRHFQVGRQLQVGRHFKWANRGKAPVHWIRLFLASTHLKGVNLDLRHEIGPFLDYFGNLVPVGNKSGLFQIQQMSVQKILQIFRKDDFPLMCPFYYIIAKIPCLLLLVRPGGNFSPSRGTECT